MLRKILRFLERVFALLGIFFVIYHLGFNLSVIYSGSMSPTLKGELNQEKDYVLTEKFSYWFRNPRRWEVVKYHTPNDLQMEVMKRVAALPGETISLKNNWLQINGKDIDRPPGLSFLKYYPFGCLQKKRAYHCTKGLFVLGDDSKDSMDSRDDGPINPDLIEGRAWLIVWPWSRIGFINP